MSKNKLHSWAARASQAWPLLTFAAKHRHVFTYDELGQHLGLPRVAVGDALGPVYRYCRSEGLPLLNLIVVRKDMGKFDNEEFNKYDVAKEQAKVFRHAWFDGKNHAAAVPSIEKLEKFVKSVA